MSGPLPPSLPPNTAARSAQCQTQTRVSGRAKLLTDAPIEWRVSPGHMPYPAAVEQMQARAAAIAAGSAKELIWLLEHPPLYTAGTSAKAADLVDPSRFDVFESGRGGQYIEAGRRKGRIGVWVTRRDGREEKIAAIGVRLKKWVSFHGIGPTVKEAA